jgi:prepilin-type N-terminal cleavage/methylation domain-containing protein
MMLQRKKQQGFTLIEMLVSVAIFTVVMVIALGALLSMSEADRKAETLKTVINNLNFALDSMSRSIRTGSSYDCGETRSDVAPTPTNCNTANYAMTFAAAPGTQTGCSSGGACTVMFCLGSASTDTCGIGAGNTTILRSINGSTPAPITAPEVQVGTVTFYIVGAPTGDGLQPKVTILLNGFVPVSGSPTTQSQCGSPGITCSIFNLETSVTQRIYDL